MKVKRSDPSDQCFGVLLMDGHEQPVDRIGIVLEDEVDEERSRAPAHRASSAQQPKS